MKVTRCEETGELVVNGRLGLVTAWLRWLQPWVVTAVIIPFGLWTYGHYHSHEELKQFAEAGSRVYSSSGEDISTDQFQTQIMAEFAKILARDVPPAEVRHRLDALELAVAANHALLLEILKERRVVRGE